MEGEPFELELYVMGTNRNVNWIKMEEYAINHRLVSAASFKSLAIVVSSQTAMWIEKMHEENWRCIEKMQLPLEEIRLIAPAAPRQAITLPRNRQVIIPEQNNVAADAHVIVENVNHYFGNPALVRLDPEADDGPLIKTVIFNTNCKGLSPKIKKYHC